MSLSPWVKAEFVYYWTQDSWNEYSMLCPGHEVLKFKTYDELYQYCQKNNINAKQV